jgi:hypothetical protein
MLIDSQGQLSDAVKRQIETQKLLDELSPTIGNAVRAGTFQVPQQNAPSVNSPFFNEKPFMGDTINITVNGAIDPEATARQIQTILNDSQARGTLGGGGLAGLVAV